MYHERENDYQNNSKIILICNFYRQNVTGLVMVILKIRAGKFGQIKTTQPLTERIVSLLIFSSLLFSSSRLLFSCLVSCLSSSLQSLLLSCLVSLLSSSLLSVVSCVLCGGVVVLWCDTLENPPRVYVQNVPMCTGTTRTHISSQITRPSNNFELSKLP